MTDSPEPAWHLLPENPAAFFGLEGGFDRKELKRRYNALLRRFKPEKFPEEFQKLRAAFESLDTQLRYGQQIRQIPKRQYDWQATESSKAETVDVSARGRDKVGSATPNLEASNTRQKTGLPLSIVQRLDEERPIDIYKDLEKRPRKSPYEFFALAVLADVVAPQDPLLFCKWLLTGLKSHSHDPALGSLLHCYFQSLSDEAAIPKILTAVSKIVVDDRFYFFTEPLWDRLLAAWPFEKFVAFLKNCESNLSDHRVHGKVAFYLHILRPALWKAPTAWLEEVFAFLNQSQEFISGNLEFDLELNYRLFQYQQNRKKFLNGHPIREEIDRAIQLYCTADEFEAERAIVACQTRLATDAEGVLDAFPASLSGESPEITAWVWICEEVSQRLDLPNANPDSTRVGESLYAMMLEIDSDESNNHWVLCALFQRFAHGAATVFAFAWPFLFIDPFFPEWAILTFINVFLAMGSVLAYWLWLRKFTVTRMLDNYRIGLATRRYRRAWRPRIVRYFAASHAPFSQVCDVANDIVSAHESKLNVSTWLPYFLRGDYGLLIYSLSQRFMR
jgi:hypothetical protein